jgi:hypothetical protein
VPDRHGPAKLHLAQGKREQRRGGGEPVVLEPAIEHHLERTEEGRDQHEADIIEPAPFPLQSPQLLFRGLGLPVTGVDLVKTARGRGARPQDGTQLFTR